MIGGGGELASHILNRSRASLHSRHLYVLYIVLDRFAAAGVQRLLLQRCQTRHANSILVWTTK